MKKKIIALIFLLNFAFSLTLNAQWARTYGGSEDDYTSSILQTIDGGYIVAGTTVSFGAGGNDIWILKFNPLGDIEWQKTCGRGRQGELAYSIQQTTDGGYIIGGDFSFEIPILSEFVILKLSPDGNVEWVKTYGDDSSNKAYSIQQTTDGGYIVAGSTKTFGVGERDFLILKLYPNGDMNSSCGLMEESNAVVFDTNISPADSHIDTGYPGFSSGDLNIPIPESNAVVYSLCSGQHTLSLSASSGGTTDPQPGDYIYDHAERISLSASPDDGYNFVGWSGDILGIDGTQYITMDSDKSVKANFSEHVIEDLIEDVKKAPCFIATAAFGSPLHPYVITLQDFRDRYLMSSGLGRKIVKLYYKYSPHIAELITNHKVLKTVVRIWLMPMVALGYSMVHFGPVKTTMMLVSTFIPLFFFVWFYRRKVKE